MQQQIMAGPGVPCQVTGLSPRLMVSFFSSGCRSRPARLGRVTAAHAVGARRPKYGRRLQGAAATSAAPELLDQHVRPGNTASNQQPLTAIRKDRFYEIEMKVCDEELDEFGVVNNAIYASYLHSGRDVMLEMLGISVDYWTSTGKAMALTELNLKYFAPLRSGDMFVVKVKPVQIKGVRMIVEHMIETLPDRKLVLEGRATVVCLDQNFRPTRVFPELSTKVFSCKVA